MSGKHNSVEFCTRTRVYQVFTNILKEDYQICLAERSSAFMTNNQNKKSTTKGKNKDKTPTTENTDNTALMNPIIITLTQMKKQTTLGKHTEDGNIINIINSKKGKITINNNTQ